MTECHENFLAFDRFQERSRSCVVVVTSVFIAVSAPHLIEAGSELYPVACFRRKKVLGNFGPGSNVLVAYVERTRGVPTSSPFSFSFHRRASRAATVPCCSNGRKKQKGGRAAATTTMSKAIHIDP